MGIADLYHYVKVDDQIVTAGQPTADQLKAVAGEGVITVINLAPSDSRNALPDEGDIVRSLGMAYHYLPVDWANPTAADFSAFEQAMAQVGTGKTLIHCAANFRVTAFYSLYAQKHLGWSVEKADQFRSQIWAGSDYPVWEKFINDMKARLTG